MGRARGTGVTAPLAQLPEYGNSLESKRECIIIMCCGPRREKTFVGVVRLTAWRLDLYTRFLLEVLEVHMYCATQLLAYKQN
jgi:hypothetical protein